MRSVFQGKRVLHVIGDSKYGGDTLYMFSLADMLSKEGAFVSICTTTPETISIAKEKNYPVHRVSSLRREINPIHDIIALVEVYKLCRKHNFHIVHTHTSKGGVIGRIAARLAGVPCVVHTIHGFAFHEKSSFIESIIYSNLERFSSLFCDIAISVNEEDRITALKKRIINRNKIVTILNGIDVSRFETPFDRDRFRTNLGLSPKDVLVGCVGRMALQKDPETFIKATHLTMQEHPDVRFMFVGDGPLMNEMNELASQLGLGNRLILPGFKTNIEDYMRSFDIFVLCSLWEGLPITLIEAMSVGLPIVATDVKGNHECVDNDCAIMVKEQSPNDIKNAVVRLLEDGELSAKIGANAKKRFQHNFTEKRMLTETFEIYTKLMSLPSY